MSNAHQQAEYQVSNIIYWHELTKSEQSEFDYDAKNNMFFRYRGNVYDVCEFVYVNIPGWDGVSADTYFSGVVMKLKGDDRVVVGTYYC